jgi:hypothetical protein
MISIILPMVIICHHAKYHSGLRQSAECHYDKYHSSECHYTECHHANCHSAQCHDADLTCDALLLFDCLVLKV